MNEEIVKGILEQIVEDVSRLEGHKSSKAKPKRIIEVELEEVEDDQENDEILLLEDDFQVSFGPI